MGKVRSVLAAFLGMTAEDVRAAKKAGIETNDIFVMVEFLNEEEIAEVAKIREARSNG